MPVDEPQIGSELAGDYYNYLQVWQQKTDEVATPDPVVRFSVTRAADDGDLYLAERAVIGLPETRVVRVWRALSTQRLEAYVAPSLGTWDRASVDGFARDPNCDVDWRLRDGEWRSELNGRCELTAGWESLSLSADGLLSARGTPAASLQRARWFKGWMGVKKQTWDPAAADDDWVFMRSFQIHNEGDIVSLIDKDGTPTGYAVQLERLVYQNTRVPVLKLGLIKEEDDRTIHYIWSEPGSKRLGMNLRWFQVGLTAQ